MGLSIDKHSWSLVTETYTGCGFYGESAIFGGLKGFNSKFVHKSTQNISLASH